MNISNTSNQLIRLNKGDLLIDTLVKLAKQHNINGAWINGLGAAKWVEVGFYDLPNKKYNWSKINQPLEIVSLQGNIAWEDNVPIIHIHGTFSDHDMKTYGGHVKELEVGGTCEITLSILSDSKLLRYHDENTGLKLLSLED